MTHAYVEARPLSKNPGDPITGYVVIANNAIVHQNATQKGAADWSLRNGYSTHVARVRHLQDRAQPAHWRAYP